MDEPYVEEALTEEVAGNERFLETGNAVVASLQAGDRDAAFQRMAPGAIRREKFDGMLDFIQTAHGSIVDFRPMQWWFIDDDTQVMLVKLLVYEHGCGAARLMFNRDDPSKIVSMWMGGNTCSPNAQAALDRSKREEQPAAPTLPR